jgi:hypothetical protein
VDGVLWAMSQYGTALNPFDLVKKETESDLFKEFETKSVRGNNQKIDTDDWLKVVYPVFDSPRIVAQDGSFTFHSNPHKSVESYANKRFHPDHLDVRAVFRWRVPSGRKGRIIADLSGLGITHRIVFPDLDGIARSLWETDVLWHEEIAARRRQWQKEQSP